MIYLQQVFVFQCYQNTYKTDGIISFLPLEYRMAQTTKINSLKIQVNKRTYTIQKKIGEGYTAQVYKAITPNDLPLCIKIISNTFYSKPQGKQLIDNQIAIISKINHPNILKFYKSQLLQQMIIVTQLCQGGNLYQQLRIKKTYNQHQSLQIMKQVIQGCTYLHQNKILHRDLKPQNIFFKDGVAKIADFGFAVQLSNLELMKTNVGSPLYMPYEALTQKLYSQKSDIFALGVIWYELLSGSTPFEATSEKQLKEKIKNNYFRNKQLKCCKSISTIIMQCLNKESSSRPTCKQLKTFIQQISVNRNKASSKISIFEQNLTSNKQITQVSKKKCTQNKKVDVFPLQQKQLNYNDNLKKDRCKTVIQVKRPKADSICQQTTKNREFNKQNKSPQAQQVFLRTQKRKTISIQQSVNSEYSFTGILRRVAKLNLTFLPNFLKVKFQYLLQKYEVLMIKIYSNQFPQVERLSQAQSLNQQLQKDELISTLSSCNTQFDFCRCAAGFVRRLLRVAKGYPQFSKNLSDLILVGQRIQKVASGIKSKQKD